MAIPVATALIDGVHTKSYDYVALGAGLPITLTGSATLGDGSSITTWEWSILAEDPDLEGGLPEGSGLAVGVHGDFTNGKATVQNPTITLDVPGGYCFSLRVQNDIGQWSDPDIEKNGEYQAIVFIKTLHGVKQPPANQKRYQDDLNQGLQRLEDLAAGVTATGADFRIAGEQPIGTYTFSASYTAMFPFATPYGPGGYHTFVAPAAGRYLVTFVYEFVGTGSSAIPEMVKLVFDQGTSTEVVVGDDSSWVSRPSGSAYVIPVFTGFVELAAGSHTVIGYVKDVEGTGSRIVGDVTAAVPVLTGWLVSGSGAGGSLVTTAQLSSDQLIDTDNTGDGEEVSGLTTVITTSAGEKVQLVLSASGHTGGATTSYRLTGFWVDGSPLYSGKWQSRVEGNYEKNISFTTTSDPLSAGEHTITVRAARLGGYGTTWNFTAGAQVVVTQSRGGLVPVESDGALVTATPRALNFIGAGVSVTDTDGRADIQLNEAITALGDLITLTDGQPVSTIDVSISVDTLIAPAAGSFSFEARVAGTYLARLNLALLMHVGGGNQTSKFKLVFDEGEASEQTVGYTDDWQVRVGANNAYGYGTMEAPVVLTAGTHTVKAYGLTINGGVSTRIVGSSVVPNAGPAIVLQAVTGSGAGGVLVTKKTITSNFVTPSEDAWHAVPELSMTVECSDETVKLDYQAVTGHTSGLSTHVVGYRVDGGAWIALGDEAGQYDTAFAGSALITVTAGPHDFDFGVYTDYGVLTLYASAVYGATRAAWASITQYRGGLVPVRHDGALVVDKPAAWDFIGPNVQVTNVGGTAKVNFNGVADGWTTQKAVKAGANQTIDTTYPTWEDVDELSLTVLTNEGEIVFIECLADINVPAVYSPFVGIFVDDVIQSQYFESGGVGYELCAAFTAMSDPLSAGSHTVKVKAARQGAETYTIYGSSRSYLKVTRVRGGYIQAENVPLLRYNGASVVNALAQPGASGTLWLTLSDTARYSATSPLSVDLTVSGLGGLDTGTEAADTWYYVYAVPGATAGTFGLICSASDPSTGPSGWNAWRYLGFFRNDGSSNIKPFDYQAIGVYRLRSGSDPNAVIYSVSGGSPATGAWVNMTLTTAIPTAVAGAVTVEGEVDSDSGGQHNFWIEPGNPPGFTPSLTYGSGRGSAFLSAQDADETTNTKTYPLFDGTLSYYWAARSGSVDLEIQVREIFDKYLTPSLSGTLPPAPARADTKLPELTYTAASQITVSPAPGEPTTIYQTLQDNKQRFVTGSLLFDFANGVADRGLDEGTEQPSVWYYMYLVPESGNDSRLTVRASDNDPDTGPTGYTNYRYLGAFRNDSSSNIRIFYQSGPLFFWRGAQSNTNDITPHAKTTLDISWAIPETANEALMSVFQQATSWNNWECYVDDVAGVWMRVNTSGSTDTNSAQFWIPTPGTKQIYHYLDGTTATTNQINVNGYHDAYLTGDRGGGGGLVASGGTATVVEATEVVTPGGGGVTSLALTSTPVSATSIKLWQDGVLMRRVTGAPSGLNEWYYNSSLNQAEFNDTLSSTWYYLEWEK